jgi:hypothetical protein
MENVTRLLKRAFEVLNNEELFYKLDRYEFESTKIIDFNKAAEDRKRKRKRLAVK